MLICHELDGRFRGDLEHIDAVAPPEGAYPALTDHPQQVIPEARPPWAGAMHLGVESKGQSVHGTGATDAGLTIAEAMKRLS